MKICFVSIFAYSLFNPNNTTPFGGSEVQLYQIAKKLAQNKKNKISFLVGDFGQKPIKIYHRIKVIKTLRPTESAIKYLIGIYQQLKFLIKLYQNKPKIIIQRAAGIETGLIGLYCKLFHKKFIYMVASSIDTDKNYRHLKPLLGIFYEFGLKHASVIICQNRDQQLNLKKYYHLESKIIKNSFTIPARISINKNGILWVGTAQPLKQPQIFLNLAKTLPQYKFTIIIPKHNLKLWNDILQQSKSIPNLKFVEKVPFKKINQYFAKAKLFINTSTYEGFPNTFVQATMNSTPIISLNVNPDKFLNKYNCGYCADGSLQKLTQYTKKLLTNKKLWPKMSHNAYQYAKKNHDINKNVYQLTKLLVL